MSLSKAQLNTIENTIERNLMKKFENYSPETKHMPFHYRLLGKDRMALYSFIQSLNTTFGTSIYEPVAESLASPNFAISKKQFVVGNEISERSQAEITDIINGLSIGKNTNKIEEIDRIRKVCRLGDMKKIKTVKVDLFVQTKDGAIHLFDLKTVKPNASNFKDFKRTLLEWIAIYFAKYPDANVNSYIAIPYNPYEPNPYERWTMKGMLDLNYELKVADEFWDFLGNSGAYIDLLNCFERVGIKLRPKIDSFFSKFR